MTRYAVEVFSLDTDYIDRIAGYPQYCDRKSWTDESYIYVFDNGTEAWMFLGRIGHHARTNFQLSGLRLPLALL